MCTINNYLLSLIKTKLKLPKYDTYRQNSVFFSPEFYFSATLVIKIVFTMKNAITSKSQQKHLKFFSQSQTSKIGD